MQKSFKYYKEKRTIRHLHPFQHPVKHPSPYSVCKSNFGAGFFVADCREFFQTNNKSNRQMMSVFIYSSSNL